MKLVDKIKMRREAAEHGKPLSPSHESVALKAETDFAKERIHEKTISLTKTRRKIKSQQSTMPDYQDDLDNRIMLELARVKYATCEQLSFYCCAPRRTVHYHLVRLQKAGLILFALSSPVRGTTSVWSITYRCATAMHTKLPSGGRRSNWPVIKQACHRNEVEIMLASKPETKGFHFVLERQLFWKNGLNPAFGEHGAKDDAHKSYFVLIDDYFMKSNRIGHAWERRHRPPRKYFRDRGRLWSNTVNVFYVVTTDSKRANLHTAWIKKHAIPASVLMIKPLWG